MFDFLPTFLSLFPMLYTNITNNIMLTYFLILYCFTIFIYMFLNLWLGTNLLLQMESLCFFVLFSCLCFAVAPLAIRDCTPCQLVKPFAHWTVQAKGVMVSRCVSVRVFAIFARSGFVQKNVGAFIPKM